MEKSSFSVFYQGVNEQLVFGGRQADDHVFGILLRMKRLIAVVLSPVTVEGFRDGGGDEEHPVEVRAGLAQRFACCEAFL